VVLEIELMAQGPLPLKAIPPAPKEIIFKEKGRDIDWVGWIYTSSKASLKNCHYAVNKR
jgi:hypothetical protein